MSEETDNILQNIPSDILEAELLRRRQVSRIILDKSDFENFRKKYPDHDLRMDILYDYSGEAGDSEVDCVHYVPMIKRKTLSTWHSIYYYEDRQILDRLEKEGKDWYVECSFVIPSFLHECVEGEYESEVSESETIALLKEIGFEMGESYNL